MAEHPNSALYRQYADRISAGDVNAVTPMLADQVIWREPSGEHAIHGMEMLAEQMRWVTSNLNPEINVHDVLANDEHTVALVEWRMQGGGRAFTSRMVEIWHVRDGRVTERWLFVEDIEGFLGFFSSLAVD